MKVIEQSIELLQITDNPEKFIEKCGRICYKSENKITKDSASKFVKKLIEKGHESVIEHAYATFKIITDRGISHEIVRHRIASYSQESTRYIAYKEEIEVIAPYNFHNHSKKYIMWFNLMSQIEDTYHALLEKGVSPQHARDILPTCLKTELVMTANFREWRHFIKLRSSNASHPKIRDIANKIKDVLVDYAPNIFGDVQY